MSADSEYSRQKHKNAFKLQKNAPKMQEIGFLAHKKVPQFTAFLIVNPNYVYK